MIEHRGRIAVLPPMVRCYTRCLRLTDPKIEPWYVLGPLSDLIRSLGLSLEEFRVKLQTCLHSESIIELPEEAMIRIVTHTFSRRCNFDLKWKLNLTIPPFAKTPPLLAQGLHFESELPCSVSGVRTSLTAAQFFIAVRMNQTGAKREVETVQCVVQGCMANIKEQCSVSSLWSSTVLNAFQTQSEDPRLFILLCFIWTWAYTNTHYYLFIFTIIHIYLLNVRVESLRTT